MGFFKDFIEGSTKKSSQWREMTNGLRPYKGYTKINSTKDKHTPAILAVMENSRLFQNVATDAVSYDEQGKQIKEMGLKLEMTENPLRAVIRSLRLGSIAKSFDAIFTKKIDFSILNFLFDLTGRVANTAIVLGEVSVRTLAGFATMPAHWLNKKIDERFAEHENPVINRLLKVGTFLLTLPLWCISQTLSVAADAFLWTRKLLDATLTLLNPLFWAGKFGYEKVKVKDVLKSFAKSVLHLIPTALIVLAGIFTGGVAVPALKALAGPLKAAGSAIVNAVLAPAAVWLKVTVATLMTGVIMAVTKLFSAGIGGLFYAFAEKSKRDEEKKLRTVEEQKKPLMKKSYNDQPSPTKVVSSASTVGVFKDLSIVAGDIPSQTADIEKVQFGHSVGKTVFTEVFASGRTTPSFETSSSSDDEKTSLLPSPPTLVRKLT